MKLPQGSWIGIYMTLILPFLTLNATLKNLL
jgi:hypothetical protein